MNKQEVIKMDKMKVFLFIITFLILWKLATFPTIGYTVVDDYSHCLEEQKNLPYETPSGQPIDWLCKPSQSILRNTILHPFATLLEGKIDNSKDITLGILLDVILAIFISFIVSFYGSKIINRLLKNKK
ncbi:hypothetical protein HY989_04590 [Candidatus Micrarchaeota archaeon]|nr:hypothetical protein [Candidatus Micrarchaeota archaeon]